MDTAHHGVIARVKLYPHTDTISLVGLPRHPHTDVVPPGLVTGIKPPPHTGTGHGELYRELQSLHTQVQSPWGYSWV